MTGITYFWGKKIERRSRPQKCLYAGIGFNILVWTLFKNADFFVPQILELINNLGFKIQNQGLKILLPLGISYYTLQAISYLVDLYRQQIEAPPKFTDFALYLAYFPKLTAGPIERPRNFLSILANRRVVDNQQIAKSFQLIILGLFRKIVIADTLFAAIPKNLFKSPENFSGLQLFIWLIVILFAIYNDFCGYTNIVRGISGFFGITLTRNFEYPFVSRSMTEFWTRWHISLSLWLRDYIYFPLSRFFMIRFYDRRNAMVLVLIPPVVTFLASGIWHGLTINFIVWGLVIGLVIGLGNYVSLRRKKTPRERLPLLKQWLSRILLFGPGLLLLSICKGGVSFIGRFLSQWLTWPVSKFPETGVLLLLIPSLWIDYVQNKSKNEFVFLSWRLVLRSFFLALAIIFIFLFSQQRIQQPFLYQGF